MVCCFVANCLVRHGKMFSFPKDAELQKKWLVACGKQKGMVKCVANVKVCEKHFARECITQHVTKNEKVILKLKEGSVPTLNLNLPKTVTKRSFSYWSQVNKLKGGPPEKLPCTGIPSYEELKRRPDPVKNISEIEVDEVVDFIVDPSSSVNYIEVQVEKDRLKPVESQDKPVRKVHLGDRERKRLRRVKEEIARLQKKIAEHRKTITAQKTRIKLLEEENKSFKNAEKALQKILTKGQIKRLLHPEHPKSQWSIEDIAPALDLRAKTGGRGYHFLRKEKKIPLPCDNTLRNWISDFQVKPGLLTDVIKIMKVKGLSMTKAEKATILTFDAIYISNKTDIESKKQQVNVPDIMCQFAIARGLFNNWTHPVFYNFRQPLTKDIINQIIASLYDIGYIVVGITTNLGLANIFLWSDLNINDTNNFLPHPSDENMKVFVFADVPYLIRLLRKHFIENGFVVDGLVLTKTIFQELREINSQERIVEIKLTERHLDIKDLDCQNVKYCAQLFSKANAKAIEFCGHEGLLQSTNWEKMSYITGLIDSWFNLLHSWKKVNAYKDTKAYGIDIEKQNSILNEMSEFAQNMRVLNQRTGTGEFCQHPFQKGILITNKSLKELLDYAKIIFSDDTFQPSYILTQRLCNNIVEKYFDKIKAIRGTNSNMTAADFQNRLKWTLLRKQNKEFLQNTNEESDSSSSDTSLDNEDLPLLNSLGYAFDDEIWNDTV